MCTKEEKMNDSSNEKVGRRFPLGQVVIASLLVLVVLFSVQEYRKKNRTNSGSDSDEVSHSPFDVAYKIASNSSYHKTEKEHAAQAERLLATISSYEEAKKARRYFRDQSPYGLDLAPVYADVAYTKWVDLSVQALAEPLNSRRSMADAVRQLDEMPFWEEPVSRAVRKLPRNCNENGSLYRFYDQGNDLSGEWKVQVAAVAKDLFHQWERVCKDQVLANRDDLPTLSKLYQEVPSSLQDEVEGYMVPLFIAQVKGSQDVSGAVKIFELVVDVVREDHSETLVAQTHLLGLVRTSSEMMEAARYLRYPDTKEKAVAAWTSAPAATKAAASRRVASYLK
jgi:hypothetical protein